MKVLRAIVASSCALLLVFCSFKNAFFPFSIFLHQFFLLKKRLVKHVLAVGQLQEMSTTLVFGFLTLKGLRFCLAVLGSDAP